MKYVFLVNPFSGKKSGIQVSELIDKIAKERNLDYEIVVTQYPNHATELAEQYSDDNTVIVALAAMVQPWKQHEASKKVQWRFFHAVQEMIS